MDKSKRHVRVLEISHGLAPGGIESFLLNIFENIDKDVIDMDFSVACDGNQFYEERVLEQGANVYHTSDLNGVKNITKHFFRLIKVLKEEGPFDVVHSHIDFFNGINLMAAWIARVPVRISHSHNTNSANSKTLNSSILTKIYRTSMKILINIFSNVKLGCSTEANKYMYGEKKVKENKCKVIPNGINLDNFYKSKGSKCNLNINDREIKFITVGRICEQKNSLFIVKVINELTKLYENIHLYWVGKGPQEKEVNELVKEYDLEGNITFLGARKDVSQLMANMDFMIFPSKWEGLPVTLVEAQISKLPCFISDNITKEVDLGLCNFISLNEGEKFWADIINNKILNNEYNRLLDKEKIEMFDIKNVCKIVEKIYTA